MHSGFDCSSWEDFCVRAIILIRILVGWVFVSEGIQKFLFPAALGVGRFAKIGLPHPAILAPVVGLIEVACGVAVIFGLWTRLAAIPLLAVIGTAIVLTKIPELHRAGEGFWFMLHDARTDFSMVLGLVFLLIAGGGPLALTRSRKPGNRRF